jgi:hypothetical protein
MSDHTSDRRISDHASDRRDSDHISSPWHGPPSGRDRRDSDVPSERPVDRRDVERLRPPTPPRAWPDADQERDRDRAWSDRGLSDKSSLRLPVPSRFPEGDRRTTETGSTNRGTAENASTYRGGLDSYRERLSSVHDSPRQSSRRGNSPESLATNSARPSERLWHDPRQHRSTPTGGTAPGPAEVSAPKPGHIQVDFDLSGLQGTASPNRAR